MSSKMPKSIDFLFLKVTLFVEWSVLFNNGVEGMGNITNHDFGELYKKYGPMVLRRCRFLLHDEDLVLDAMQDVFVKIIENNCKIKDVCSSLFYVTATRVCLNIIRANKIRTGPDFDEISKMMADGFSEIEVEKIEARDVLDNIFSGRDEKDSMIATLHFVDGLTLEETAEQVGMSVSGVRKRITELKKYSASCVK